MLALVPCCYKVQGDRRVLFVIVVCLGGDLLRHGLIAHKKITPIIIGHTTDISVGHTFVAAPCKIVVYMFSCYCICISLLSIYLLFTVRGKNY